MKLTRYDKWLIVVLMLVSIFLIVPLFNNAPQTKVAKVYVKDEEVLSIDLSQDATYEVQGTNGEVIIEVKEGAVAVTQENSPHHLCSKQGYVDQTNVPIVCLPNETVVQIEGEAQEDTVIQ